MGRYVSLITAFVVLGVTVAAAQPSPNGECFYLFTYIAHATVEVGAKASESNNLDMSSLSYLKTKHEIIAAYNSKTNTIAYCRYNIQNKTSHT